MKAGNTIKFRLQPGVLLTAEKSGIKPAHPLSTGISFGMIFHSYGGYMSAWSTIQKSRTKLFKPPPPPSPLLVSYTQRVHARRIGFDDAVEM